MRGWTGWGWKHYQEELILEQRKNRQVYPTLHNLPLINLFFYSKYENRTVYEFDVDGKKKYVILHEEDKYGRGKHFHAAEPNTKNPHNPIVPGKYNQLPGHHPENIHGFKKKGCH